MSRMLCFTPETHTNTHHHLTTTNIVVKHIFIYTAEIILLVEFRFENTIWQLDCDMPGWPTIMRTYTTQPLQGDCDMPGYDLPLWGHILHNLCRETVTCLGMTYHYEDTYTTQPLQGDCDMPGYDLPLWGHIYYTTFAGRLWHAWVWPTIMRTHTTQPLQGDLWHAWVWQTIVMSHTPQPLQGVISIFKLLEDRALYRLF